MSDIWRNRLSEYLDGELKPEEKRALERHLEGCDACVRELEVLRRVVGRLDAAPDREPARDLWPDLARRIATAESPPELVSTQRGWSHWASRLAAALAGVAVLGSAWMWFTGRTGPDPARHDPTAAMSSPTAGEQYERAAAGWQEVLVGRALPTELAEPVQNELAAFDHAIVETRQALVQDPANVDLQAHLTRILRARMRFVSHVEGWAGEES